MASEWTADQLKEYVDSLTAARNRESEALKESLNERLESMNQFRSQLTAQAATFMTRPEYEAKHQDLSNQLDALSKLVVASQAKSTGVTSLANLFFYVLIALTSIAGVVTAIVLH